MAEQPSGERVVRVAPEPSAEERAALLAALAAERDSADPEHAEWASAALREAVVRDPRA